MPRARSRLSARSSDRCRFGTSKSASDGYRCATGFARSGRSCVCVQSSGLVWACPVANIRRSRWSLIRLELRLGQLQRYRRHCGAALRSAQRRRTPGRCDHANRLRAGHHHGDDPCSRLWVHGQRIPVAQRQAPDAAASLASPRSSHRASVQLSMFSDGNCNGESSLPLDQSSAAIRVTYQYTGSDRSTNEDASSAISGETLVRELESGELSRDQEMLALDALVTDGLDRCRRRASPAARRLVVDER